MATTRGPHDRSGVNLYDSRVLERLRNPCRPAPAAVRGDAGRPSSTPTRRTTTTTRVLGPRKRGVTRKGMESSSRLGRHRWTTERTASWLAECRRLHPRLIP
ncbi:hypothetical protein [Streptomyces albicerus]|uniref:hypothetical protein n=1 Tax=Streptomyces albicerus TaxID=2569859 RepID=UPI00384FFE30